jgi:hypothetical protein
LPLKKNKKKHFDLPTDENGITINEKAREKVTEITVVA